MRFRAGLVFLMFFAVASFGQEAKKPPIGKIDFLPSDPITPTGDCKSSTAGYLKESRQKTMTIEQLGNFLSKSLRDGYVVTVYPATKSGIFVSMQCTNTTARP